MLIRDNWGAVLVLIVVLVANAASQVRFDEVAVEAEDPTAYQCTLYVDPKYVLNSTSCSQCFAPECPCTSLSQAFGFASSLGSNCDGMHVVRFR